MSNKSTKMNDVYNLSNFLNHNILSKNLITNIALLSPSYKQYEIFRKKFKNVNIVIFNYKSWNLNNKGEHFFDLIYAGNIFHYSSTPEKWFDNVLNCCKLFLIQDLINRKRGVSDSELGSDGDIMRYSYEPNFISSYENAFLLNSLENNFIDFKQYNYKIHSHFIALIKGNDLSINRKKISTKILVQDYIFKFKYYIKYILSI